MLIERFEISRSLFHISETIWNKMTDKSRFLRVVWLGEVLFHKIAKF